jgi:DNA-binding response OmpR family regulator
MPLDLGEVALPKDHKVRLALLGENDAVAAHILAYLSTQSIDADKYFILSDLIDRLSSDGGWAPPDVVILESTAMLGGALPRLSRIRRVSDVPCIILGEDADEVARIVLLEAGADDCLVMPVSPREILARIRALLRRLDPASRDPASLAPVPRADREPAAAANRVDLGQGWTLCHKRRDLYRPGGERCLLTTAEFDLLDCLVQRAGTAVTREDICRIVYRRPYWAEDRSVDNLVVRLRRKLETDTRRPEVLHTIRSMGYMFAGFPTSLSPLGSKPG